MTQMSRRSFNSQGRVSHELNTEDTFRTTAPLPTMTNRCISSCVYQKQQTRYHDQPQIPYLYHVASERRQEKPRRC